VPMGALIASHVIWDIWIFLVQPTTPATPAGRGVSRGPSTRRARGASASN
jgi:hypothetical protein